MVKSLSLLSLALILLVCVDCSRTRSAASEKAPTPIRDLESVNAVTGSFTLGDKWTRSKSTVAATLTQAYACLVKNRKDAARKDVVILLTEKPIARRALAIVEDEDAERGARNLDVVLGNRAVRGIALRLAVDRKVAAEAEQRVKKIEQESGDLQKTEEDRKVGDSRVTAHFNSLTNDLVFNLEIKSISADKVEGHIKSLFDDDDSHKADINFTVKVQPEGWTGGLFYQQPPTKLGPGRASGQIEIDGKAVKLNYVYARLLDYDFVDEGNNTLKLWFTEQPVEEAALGDDSPKNFLAMKRGGNGVVLTYSTTPAIDPSESIFWRVGQIQDGTTSFGLGDLRDLKDSISGTEGDYTRFDSQSIEGRLYTVFPAERFNHIYKVDLLFNAPVVQPNTADAPVTLSNGGQSLPADGGAPGKAYLQALERMRSAKNFAEMIEVLQIVATAEKAAKMKSEFASLPAEQQNLIFNTLHPIDNPHITSGLVKDNKATLRLTGTADGNPASEVVNLHLEAGQWKIGRVNTRVE